MKHGRRVERQHKEIYRHGGPLSVPDGLRNAHLLLRRKFYVLCRMAEAGSGIKGHVLHVSAVYDVFHLGIDHGRLI